MANLPKAMGTIRTVFDKYAKNKDTLNKEQMAELLREQFGMEPGKNDEADKMFKMLDNDKSGGVDFPEFVTFVASLCVILSEK